MGRRSITCVSDSADSNIAVTTLWVLRCKTTAGDVVRLRTVGRIGALDKLVREWSGPQLDGVGIGHTRWATHRTVTEGNAHPHTDCGGRISVVHNGIIENEGSLRDALTGAGRRFATSVDSEVLCHLIEEQRQHCGDLVKSAAQPGRPSHAVDQ